MLIQTVGTVVAVVVLSFCSFLFQEMTDDVDIDENPLKAVSVQIVSFSCYISAIFLFPVVYTLGWLEIEPIILATFQISVLFFLTPQVFNDRSY
jgi:hypothetical protein